MAIKVKRSHEIKVRLSEEELQTLNASARECRLSRESYIRMRLKGYIPKPTPSFELIKTLNELRYIGNNINQIAYKLHLTGNFDADLYNAQYNKIIDSIYEIKDILVKPDKEDYGDN